MHKTLYYYHDGGKSVRLGHIWNGATFWSHCITSLYIGVQVVSSVNFPCTSSRRDMQSCGSEFMIKGGGDI